MEYWIYHILMLSDWLIMGLEAIGSLVPGLSVEPQGHWLWDRKARTHTPEPASSPRPRESPFLGGSGHIGTHLLAAGW